MTGTQLETEIRDALAAEAAGYPLPEDLPERTLAARPSAEPQRWYRGRRALYALGAVALVPALLVIGLVSTSQPLLQHGPAISASKADQGISPLAGAGSIGGLPAAAPTPAPPGITAQTPSAGFAPSILRTGSVEVQVGKGRFQSAWSAAMAVASRYAGLVSDSSAQTVNGKLARGTLTLRVPADKLDAALADLQHLGTTVSLNTTSQDVSGQFADMDARLKALQAQEAEYLQLLPSAKTTADVLAIRAPLDSVRQQIETLEGSQAYLQGQVAMSTLQATLSEPGADLPSAQTPGRFSLAWQRAKTGVAAVLAGLLIAAGYLAVPVLLAVPLVLFVRRSRRRLA